jgi:hypothetical protein
MNGYDYDIQRRNDPEYIFDMDGTPHLKGDVTGCCSGFEKQCPKCKGYSHYQPTYGGYYYKCENCGHEFI